jgi:hypothetical protein
VIVAFAALAGALHLGWQPLSPPRVSLPHRIEIPTQGDL